MTPDQLERLSSRHAERHQAILVKLLLMLMGLWRPYRSWYDEDLVRAQAARSATLVELAGSQTYLLAREYVKQVSSARDGRYRDMAAPPRTVPYQRTAVPLEVYSRPAEQYRYARSLGEPQESAVQAATDRLESLATMDLSLARRAGSSEAMKSLSIERFRRVIHPELAKGGTCGLCVAASTRVYYVGELLPIHDGCHCDVAEVGARFDPAELLNGVDLGRLYGDAGSTAAEDLKRTRYRVDEHGELGAVLVPENHRESTGHRSNRTKKVVTPVPVGPDQWAAELRTLERSLTRLRGRAAGGEDLAGPIQYQADRVALLRARIAAS